MSCKKIAVIEYKIGNSTNVYNAFKFLNINAILTNKKNIIKNCVGIVLPGVGAFGAALHNLQKLNLFDFIINEIKNGKPFLGICLGLQLLFEKSEENPHINGLSILKGRVVKFKNKNIKIPHIGWNQILIKKATPLFKKIKNKTYFYFDHSFHVKPQNEEIVSSYAVYGEKFVSSIQKDNIFGVQFHPEKSQNEGLELLKNFYTFCKSF